MPRKCQKKKPSLDVTNHGEYKRDEHNRDSFSEMVGPRICRIPHVSLPADPRHLTVVLRNWPGRIIGNIFSI